VATDTPEGSDGLVWEIIYLLDGHVVTSERFSTEDHATQIALLWESSGEGHATIAYDPEGRRQRLHER
jgi:hypothetical protein